MKQNSISEFLKDIDIIIYDLDGVITSETVYWSCAALTCCHMAGLGYDLNRLSDIREMVFCGKETIRLLKDKGVNTNWDLGFVVYCVYDMLGLTTADNEAFIKVLEYLKSLDKNAIELYQFIAEKTGNSRDGKLWADMQAVFNEYFAQISVNSEECVVDELRLRGALKSLTDGGKLLGVGTGRPRMESLPPLKAFGIFDFFDENRIATYTEIQKAEQKHSVSGLTKPHPYIFELSAIGINSEDYHIAVENKRLENRERILVVGDAGSDILAAKAAGMKFAAVLTGVSGEAAEDYFREQGADIILKDVTELSLEKRLVAPLSDEDIEGLEIMQSVKISGRIYMARDAAHKRMMEMLKAGEPLPFPVEGAVIYYAGPCPPKPGQVIGSCGPTTSGRMDAYAPTLLDLGLKGMIGKGERSEEVLRSIRKNKAAYFGATGGAGALLAKHIKSKKVIAFPELGTEALCELEVRDFPVILLIK